MSERGVSGKEVVARRLHLTCLVGALVFAFSYGSSVAAAAGDTWEGTWERTELPGKHLFLTQTGSAVHGHYDWNDASGVFGGTVSGAKLEASFTENRYEGSATLTISGTTFTGKYTGTNRETGGPIEGSFNGRCIAGACLGNGGSPPAVSHPRHAHLHPSGAGEDDAL